MVGKVDVALVGGAPPSGGRMVGKTDGCCTLARVFGFRPGLGFVAGVRVPKAGLQLDQ